ncbi:hypothetical protein [Pedobacter cryoconitis]|uniref:Uncharacterized protein n=1 Tax=Pedobacter cryoconitis TaxID=188932 RepID=A0A7X0J1H4_9SPHI|nr:hypothetical protein [Pedobacter cryoconitis]MBB6499103.1 hypothetical protein [Pedobacter cryoconitis]
MAKQSLNTIKAWFKTGLKPTQQQFWDTWDSFWHKDQTIPSSAIENLDNRFQEKADQEAFTGHLTDGNAHHNLFSSKADLNHTHPISQIDGLQQLLNIKANREDITIALENYDAALKAGVPEDGDTFMKLYEKIADSFKEITVANIAARDAFNITTLPMNLFVIDDGDGRWALYKATTKGTNATYLKISDPDLLNAAMSASQIKAAYESNPDTNAFTDPLLAKLNKLQDTAIASDPETQISDVVTEDNKVISRLKLFNWWTWIKSQSQIITVRWSFSSGITLRAGILTPDLQDGAIERDENGTLWSTERGVRNRLLSVNSVNDLPELVPGEGSFLYVSRDKCIYYSDGIRWNVLVRSSVPTGGNPTNLIKTIRQVTTDEYAALPATEKDANTLYISKGSPYNVITIPPPVGPVIIDIGDIDLSDKQTIEYCRLYGCPANYSLPNDKFFQISEWHQDIAQDVIVQIFHLNKDNTETKVSEYIGRGVTNWYLGEQSGTKIIKYILNPLGVKKMKIGFEIYYLLVTPKFSNFEINKDFINSFKNLQYLYFAQYNIIEVNKGLLDCTALKDLIEIRSYITYNPSFIPTVNGNTYLRQISLHPEAKIQYFEITFLGSLSDNYNDTLFQWWAKFSTIPENLSDTTNIKLAYSNVASSELDRLLIELDKAGRYNGRIEITNNQNWNGSELEMVNRTSVSNAAKVALLQKGWAIIIPE